MSVLVGGGTGFIGKRLVTLLASSGYDVTIVSRMPGLNRITWHELEAHGLPKGTTAVVNLAGQNVLDPTRRWTPGFKQNVWNSRVNSAASMVRAISKTPAEPGVFVNVSGVSLYPPAAVDAKETFDESDPGVEYDFMSRLCFAWEAAATVPDFTGWRGVRVRSGVVLGRHGGMIGNIYLPFFLGLGGPVASGNQPLPWIHIEDLCAIILLALKKADISGALNAVAPQIITNGDFSMAFAKALRRPAAFRIPESVLNLMFAQERAVLLTTGARVASQRLQGLGFEFQYPKIEEACLQLVGRKR
ncbi:epimerase family protein SDR39U1 [Phlebotomus argentipes]|uniref:epimerase family protein SDR39U1 n=1 Tax=Phlebotomus argentipes TaxID=94469 RepID=UPI002892BA64|nr:epimerase family protein SDR39U1 [Phlebotomus argentipes]